MTPKKPLKTGNLIKTVVLGYKKMFGDMVVRYMPNSDPWGPPGTPFMTIVVFYVNPQIPNLEYLEANEIYKSQEVSHLLSHQISRRMPSESCQGFFFDPSYDHIYKCDNFG